MKKGLRVALVVPGGLALVAGLDAALLLLGLPAPITAERLPAVHGMVLVLGFVGTLVAVERAVALGVWWGYLAPACLGLGALVVLSPAPLAVGHAVTVGGAASLVGVYRALWRRQPSAALALQALGAVLALAGALLWWAGVPVPGVVPWLSGFLVLTIVGERVELARVALRPRDEGHATALGTLVAAGVVAATLWADLGSVLLGAALLALVAWLLRNDVARRTIRGEGLPRYMAWCLLAGYGWLAVAGAAWVVGGRIVEGPAYDAVVHAVFLGFTLSMIMAHAPVVLPAVLGVRLPHHHLLYVPVAVLHLSLALRVLGGDLHGQAWALRLGGALNIAAVLLFAGLAALTAVRHRRTERVSRPVPAVVPEEVAP